MHHRWIQMFSFPLLPPPPPFLLLRWRGRGGYLPLLAQKQEWNGEEGRGERDVYTNIGKFMKRCVWWIDVISGGSGVEKYEVSGLNTCLARVHHFHRSSRVGREARAFDFTFVRAAKYRARRRFRRVNNPLFRETFSNTRSSIMPTVCISS